MTVDSPGIVNSIDDYLEQILRPLLRFPGHPVKMAQFGMLASAPFSDHNIRAHTVACVSAVQIAHLMRREADHRAGQHHSVVELLNQLAGIGETVMIYPSTGGRPKARRMFTETTNIQN